MISRRNMSAATAVGSVAVATTGPHEQPSARTHRRKELSTPRAIRRASPIPG
jgi:hypothetical protein